MRTKLVVAVVLALASALACTGDQAAAIRPFTYPPGYTYYRHRDVEMAMHGMAHSAERLHELLASDEPLNAAQRPEVLELLVELEAGARALKRPGSGASNQPTLGRDLDQFIGDVVLARQQAAADPPNDFLAGTVTASCTRCHVHARPQVTGVSRPLFFR